MKKCIACKTKYISTEENNCPVCGCRFAIAFKDEKEGYFQIGNPVKAKYNSHDVDELAGWYIGEFKDKHIIEDEFGELHVRKHLRKIDERDFYK